MATPRVLYFDILNIAATLAVVFLHCNGIVHSYSAGGTWASALVVEVLFYWAVPVFFMLTGAKTLGYRSKRGTKEFLKRRMCRIFGPFLFWSLAIFVFRFSGLLSPPPNTSIPFTVGGFIDALMTNGIEVTYWFFFAMFGVTVSIPVLSLLADNKRILWYIVGGSFLLTSVMPYLFHFLGLSWNSNLSLSVASGYIMYVVLGWLLADKDFRLTKNQLGALYVLALLCLALRYGYTYVSSSELGQVDRLFFNYQAFTAVIPSAALFIWCKNNEHRFRFAAKHEAVVRKISGASFGVYLIHKVVLDNIVCGVLGVSWSSLALRTLFPLLIYLVCLVVVLVIKRVPLFRKVVP